MGEIDLIAKRWRTIVFIEVKTRNHGICEGIITEQQQIRIKQAANLFLAKNSQYSNYNIRFDFVLIRPYHFPLVIKNAW